MSDSYEDDQERRWSGRRKIRMEDILLGIHRFEQEHGRHPQWLTMPDSTARALLDQMAVRLAGPDGYPYLHNVEELDGGSVFGVRVRRRDMADPWVLE